LYFLSILCNGLAGFILLKGKDGDAAVNRAGFSINNPTFHLVLGILCTVTGVLKLLAPIPLRPDATYGIIILGDLIPSATGIIAGLLLIFGIYRQDNEKISDSQGTMDKLGITLLAFRKPIGIALLAASVIHFLFPYVLFL
jgi:hypothetical protein